MANLNLIKVASTEEIRNKAAQIEKEKGAMEALMNDMKAKVVSLSDFWKSESGTNYVEKYQNVTTEINASLENLARHVANLRMTAEIIEQKEKENVQKVSGLSTSKMFNN